MNCSVDSFLLFDSEFKRGLLIGLLDEISNDLDVCCSNEFLSHRIHVWYIYLIYHKNQLNVGEYTIHGSYGYGMSFHETFLKYGTF